MYVRGTGSLRSPWPFAIAIGASALILMGLPLRQALAGGGPQNVLVIVNDRSPDSQTVGAYYVAKRGIPATNVLHVDTPTGHTIDYAEFQKLIEQPLRAHLKRYELGPQIDFIVLTQGLPFRVTVGGRAKRVSIQALLAALDTPFAGEPSPKLPVHQNPYLMAGQALRHDRAVGGYKLFGVTALAAFTVDDCKALVDRSLLSDTLVPPKPMRVIFQDARANASGRNRGYDPAIADLARFKNVEATHVEVGADVVTKQTDIIGYMSGGAYSKLKPAQLSTNKFLPGAIADALQSFGAVPRNFVEDGKYSQFPITWFVRHGVTGVHGTTDEPYAHTFPSVRLFALYLEGYNLAEAFVQSLPFVYWHNMVVGDPLAQPFARRPAVKLTAAPTGPLAGELSVPFVVKPQAPPGARAPMGIARVEVFVDGVRHAVLPGDAASVTLDTRTLRNGTHALWIVAIGDHPTEPQGVATLTLEVANPLAVMRAVPAAGARNVSRTAPWRLELNGAVESAAATRFAVTLADAQGRAAKGDWRWEPAAGIGRFTPAVPLAPSTAYTLALRESAEGRTLFTATYRTTCAGFRLGAAAEVRAGAPLAVTLDALDGAGATDAAYAGTVTVTATDPNSALPEKPLVFAKGKASFEVVLTRAGATTVTVTDAKGEVRATHAVTVTPAALAGVAFDSPETHLLGRPFPLIVRACDAYGNTVNAGTWKGTITATLDGTALLDRAVTLDGAQGAQAALGELRLLKAGTLTLTATSADTETAGASSIAKSVAVEDRGVPQVLLLGPFPEPDPAKRLATDLIAPGARGFAPAPNGVDAPKALGTARLWRAYTRPNAKPFDLNAMCGGRQTKCSAYLAVYVESPKRQPVRLALGADDGAVVWLNGKRRHEKASVGGLALTKDEVAGLELREGANLLVLKITQGGGGYGVDFAFRTPAGKPVEGLVYRLRPRAAPKGLTLSGTVAVAGAGVAGVLVAARREGGGRALARTDAAGFFAFQGLAPGAWAIAPELRKCAPADQEVTLATTNVAGIDFKAPDVIGPAVALEVAGQPVGGTVEVVAPLRITAAATDNVGVVWVQFFLDGKPVGEPLIQAPFALPIDPATLRPKSYTITATARDAAGNTTTGKPLQIKVVRDRIRPRLRLTADTRAGTWSGTVTVTVTASDRYGVGEVRVTLDGAALPAAATTTGRRGERVVTFAVVAKKLKAGRHRLEALVTDLAGNRSTKAVAFATR